MFPADSPQEGQRSYLFILDLVYHIKNRFQRIFYHVLSRTGKEETYLFLYELFW